MRRLGHGPAAVADLWGVDFPVAGRFNAAEVGRDVMHCRYIHTPTSG
ncbi:hypothetical protein ThrDRAFT_03712 [Frankia casuarinae]|jgi:hypothetical protein|nr:hypothetical protein ThrDRAFT_03712 [Frankia casuarinae]KDA41751.1 hypothetical protein BMG523Draft_03438 [Frankia sp. BMG5.23]KEZ35162.1 hypothetical protein CEDDRAFT_03498 [Frankia sp. CeD]